MDCGLKKMNKMDYGLKKIKDTMAKAEVMWSWVMMSWWNFSIMKSIKEQRDDQILIYNQYFLLGISGVDRLRLSALHTHSKTKSNFYCLIDWWTVDYIFCLRTVQ